MSAEPLAPSRRRARVFRYTQCLGTGLSWQRQRVGGEPHRLHYHTEAATKVARVGHPDLEPLSLPF
jgi:hypothetical protein